MEWLSVLFSKLFKSAALEEVKLLITELRNDKKELKEEIKQLKEEMVLLKKQNITSDEKMNELATNLQKLSEMEMDCLKNQVAQNETIRTLREELIVVTKWMKKQ